MNKFLIAIASLVLLASPAIAQQEYSCPGNSPSWEEGKTTFDTSALTNGGHFLVQMNENDGSFAILYDFRGAPDIDMEFPIYALIFDPSGCYVTSLFFSVQQVQDAYGIVLS